MKKNNYIIVFIVLVISLACNKTSAPDCFKKTGIETEEERVLTPFDVLVLDANIDVTIAIGAESKVIVRGGKNMLPKIITTVTNNTLTIENKNNCNFVRGYKHKITIEITAPYYKYVVANSIGNIKTTDDFQQDTFVVRSEAGDITINGIFNEIRTSSHGNGNVYFKGVTNSLFSYMNGTNYLYASEATIVDYVFVESISIADAYVKAPDGGVLEYHLWKSGNVFYLGNPNAINGKVEGTGRVLKK